MNITNGICKVGLLKGVTESPGKLVKNTGVNQSC